MEDLVREFFWLPLAMLGMGIAYVAIWTAHKQQERQLDVLKAYAEQGKDPPEAVLEALTGDEFPSKKSRALNFAMTALYAIFALGFGALAFWFSQSPSGWIFVMAFGIASFSMAATGACVFIYALLTPRKRDEP